MKDGVIHGKMDSQTGGWFHKRKGGFTNGNMTLPQKQRHGFRIPTKKTVFVWEALQKS